MRDRAILIGRWQPFHLGHQKLIKEVLKKDKEVIIVIRKTKIAKNNPYTVEERKKMIKKWAKLENIKLKIIAIPDFEEIIVGRDVGYKVIRLSEDIENISGTKIRAKLK